jgi:hypothetical protein
MSIVVLALGRIHRSINSKLFLAPIGRIATTYSAYNMMVVRAFSCLGDFQPTSLLPYSFFKPPRRASLN